MPAVWFGRGAVPAGRIGRFPGAGKQEHGFSKKADDASA